MTDEQKEIERLRTILAGERARAERAEFRVQELESGIASMAFQLSRLAQPIPLPEQCRRTNFHPSADSCLLGTRGCGRKHQPGFYDHGLSEAELRQADRDSDEWRKAVSEKLKAASAPIRRMNTVEPSITALNPRSER